MRNLKRALSLTLASVMLLGMMVVGSSAAVGYDDVADTDNVEAIEVLQAIEVMVGDERGFGPERPVNRAEMAVVMGKLLNLDYNYYATSCPFDDVYDWARGYVGACYANKIVSGRGDGVYDPGATVTAVEASSMLMRALGYFQYANDVADGFELATVRQGTNIGIYDGVGSSATEPMTRNQVAQMVLNALQCGMVQPDGRTVNLTTPDGSVYTGKVNYVFVTSGKPFANAISDTQATSVGSQNDNTIVELGEQLYNGELKLEGESRASRFNTRDVFSRPARKWEYKGKEIGTYMKKELLKQEYTTKVTGADLYDLLGKGTVDVNDGYRFVIAIDGVEYDDPTGRTILTAAKSYFDQSDLYRTNKDTVGATGKGVLTQVFVDTEYSRSSEYTVYINIINTYLAKAREDYDVKDDDVRVDVYALKEYSTSKEYYKWNPDDNTDGTTKLTNIFETMPVDGDDFNIKDVKNKDLFLVRVAQGEIQEMVAPEIISKATINAFSRRDWVNMDGTQYDYASTARYDADVLYRYDNPNLKDITYNVILDKYGYAIGLERNDDPDQYVFLTGIEDTFSNLTTRQVDANVIHVDGTMETVRVNMKDSFKNGKSYTAEPSQANTWCTYRVDSNGVYTLQEVPTTLGADDEAAQWATDVKKGDEELVIDQKHISLPTSLKTPAVGGTDVRARANSVAYGNDKTVYINVELDEVPVDYPASATRRIIDDVTSVNTGHRNVKISVENVINAHASGTLSEAGAYVAPANEIYTLYDDDNYIIAVVTIGEDEGVASNWVYVHSASGRNGVKSEAYNGNKTSSRAANDGKWTWSREVILNGKKTEIHEVGEDLKWLHEMNQGEWYEVKYDADGNVRKAESLKAKLDANVAADGFVDNIETVKDAVTKKDTVLFSSNTFGQINKLEFNRQGTLYVKEDVTKGFAVAPDVKVVLSLANKSGAPFKDVTDTYEGYDGLRDALNDMNVKYQYQDWTKVELNAILVNNSATVIVINDRNPAPDNKPGTIVKPGETGDIEVTWLNSQWPTAATAPANTAYYTFYVNGVPVAADDLLPAGVGKTKIVVTASDTVGIAEVTNGGTAKFDIAGMYYVDTGKTVVGTVDSATQSITFKTGKSITLDTAANIKTAVYKESNANFTVKYDASITGKTEKLTEKDITTKLVELTAANKLEITFTLPEGYTANKAGGSYAYGDITVNASVNGASIGNLSTSGATYAYTSGTKEYKWTSDTLTGAILTDGAVLTVQFATTYSAPAAGNATVKYVAGSYGVDASNTSKTLVTLTKDSTSPVNMKFVIANVPDYLVDNAKVTYTLAGTSKDGTYTDTFAVADGEVTCTNAGTIYATGDTVTVTITGIAYDSKVALTAGKASGVPGTVAIGNSTDEIAVGTTAVAYPEDITISGLPTVVNTKDVKVSWTLEGISSGKTSGSGTYQPATQVITIPKADIGDIKPSGTAAVKLTITAVEYTEMAETGLFSVSGSLSGKNASTAAAGGAVKLELKDGKYVNKEDITVTITFAADFDAEKSGTVTAPDGQFEGSISVATGTVAAGNKSVTLTIAAGKLTINPGRPVALEVTQNA